MLVALALLGPSLSHLASGVAIVTGSGERDGWLMAAGIDLGFVALELALLVAPATARPAVARYASPAIIGTLVCDLGGNERLCLRLARARLDDLPGNRSWLCRAGPCLRAHQDRRDHLPGKIGGEDDNLLILKQMKTKPVSQCILFYGKLF
jgi:hypothetical protein